MDSTLYGKLLSSALRYLSFRPRSIKETRDFLTNKLKTWGEEDIGITERVLTNLREMGYLDDTKFAQWLVDSRRRHKPRGERLIRSELKQKGIREVDIDDSIQANDDQSDELSRARNAIRNVSEIWGNLPRLEQRRKIFGFLLRRGFSVEVATKIVDEPGENR